MQALDLRASVVNSSHEDDFFHTMPVDEFLLEHEIFDEMLDSPDTYGDSPLSRSSDDFSFTSEDLVWLAGVCCNGAFDVPLHGQNVPASSAPSVPFFLNGEYSGLNDWGFSADPLDLSYNNTSIGASNSVPSLSGDELSIANVVCNFLV